LRCPANSWKWPRLENHSLSADAIGPVSASRFGRSELVGFIQASRNMTRLMLAATAEELKRSQDQMLLLGRGTPEEQLIAFLASWRKRARGSSDSFVALPMARRDIAAHLGMAPETLIRTFAKLEQKKMIGIVADGVELLDQPL
jgi:CRP-like cAMP-binding protein